MAQRAAEVALHRAHEKATVLLGQRTVEAQRGADDLVILARALRSDVERGRIAGEVDDEEDRQRDAEEQHHRPRETPGQVAEHERNVA